MKTEVNGPAGSVVVVIVVVELAVVVVASAVVVADSDVVVVNSSVHLYPSHGQPSGHPTDSRKKTFLKYLPSIHGHFVRLSL